MTASKLILHHTYSDGVAFDLSGNGNHGTLENVSIVGGNVEFTGGPQVVRVKASKTLTTLPRRQSPGGVPGCAVRDERHERLGRRRGA